MKLRALIFVALVTGCASQKPDAKTPDNPEPELTGCDANTADAVKILTRDCAGCHGGATPGQNQGGFSKILDTQALTMLTSAYAKDDTGSPAVFLTPGDPEHSRIYVRIVNNEMPPQDIIGLPAYPRPTASDKSLLQAWIKNCVQ
jgi:hypothetical protein